MQSFCPGKFIELTYQQVSKLGIEFRDALEFVILCNNRWLQFEVIAHQRSVFLRCRVAVFWHGHDGLTVWTKPHAPAGVSSCWRQLARRQKKSAALALLRVVFLLPFRRRCFVVTGVGTEGLRRPWLGDRSALKGISGLSTTLLW